MDSQTVSINRSLQTSKLGRLRKRLAVRQAMLVVSIACALGLLATCVQIYFDHSRQANALTSMSEKQLASVEEATTNALIELNEDLANAIVKGLLGHEIFMSATIATPNGYTLATQSREKMTNLTAQLSHSLFGEPQELILELRYREGTNLINIGSLAVIVDTCSVGEQFLHRAMISLVTGMLKSLALAIAVLIVFYFTLTKPLSLLADQLNNLNVRDRPGERVALPDESDIEELQIISDATNAHLGLIEKHVYEIEAGRSALRNINQGLEKTVEERTKGLTNEIEERLKAENQLRQALKAAEDNANAKSQFLANMSHELRTPLNAIIGYSEFLTLQPSRITAETRGEYLEHVKESGHHLLMLVNNILDLSRMSAGQMPVDIVDVDVNELSQEAAMYLEPLVAQNNNSLIFELGPDINHVQTDRVRLKQVLINLVGNAAKFTKNGKVTIKTLCCDPVDEMVCIHVADTGIGIPAEDLDAIFENFTQVDTRLSRNFEGSGLGLSIVRETCELLGWTIDVDSTLGEGSRFIIKIPISYRKAA